jgi:hypothetical protein
VELKIEPRVLPMLGKHSTIEVLAPAPCLYISKNDVYSYMDIIGSLEKNKE